MSAVEGLTTVKSGFRRISRHPRIAVAILIGLFAIQAGGRDKVGLMFGR